MSKEEYIYKCESTRTAFILLGLVVKGLRLKGDGHVWRPKRPPGETTSGNHESNSGLGGWVPKLKLSLNIATCD